MRKHVIAVFQAGVVAVVVAGEVVVVVVGEVAAVVVAGVEVAEEDGEVVAVDGEAVEVRYTLLHYLNCLSIVKLGESIYFRERKVCPK